MAKECGSCTRCCEGWLLADIKGQKIGNGKACIFVERGKGCKVYNLRPKDPCATYLCGWRIVEEMPEEFKPNKSGVIFNYKDNGDNPYWAIVKAPKNPTVEFLSWAVTYVMAREGNIVWYVDDKAHWMGNEDFCKQMEEEHNG